MGKISWDQYIQEKKKKLPRTSLGWQEMFYDESGGPYETIKVNSQLEQEQVLNLELTFRLASAILSSVLSTFSAVVIFAVQAQ